MRLLVLLSLACSLGFGASHTFEDGNVTANTRGRVASRVPEDISNYLQSTDQELDALERLIKNLGNIRTPSLAQLERRGRYQIVLAHVQEKKKLLSRLADLYITGKDKPNASAVRALTDDIKTFLQKSPPTLSLAENSLTVTDLMKERLRLSKQMQGFEARIDELSNELTSKPFFKRNGYFDAMEAEQRRQDEAPFSGVGVPRPFIPYSPERTIPVLPEPPLTVEQAAKELGMPVQELKKLLNVK